jgi:hypothetical protein
MTEQDSGFKERMDDFLFTVVKEPSTPPSKPPTGTIPEEAPEENVLQ